MFKNNRGRDANGILRVISDISLKNGAANGVQAGFYSKDKPIVRPENIRSTKSFDARLNKADKVFVKFSIDKKLYDIKAPQKQDVEASNGSPYSRGSLTSSHG